ncbi:MAM and LDL-receptor class A domain-containing protein 2-like [Sycon ciliatum]|uniref:MAM and LDL-receptor class A domain-containing protein 2-like n=1 Tax=Sycon ciliatum TaxID=27933 RepID=UPI0031F62A28
MALIALQGDQHVALTFVATRSSGPGGIAIDDVYIPGACWGQKSSMPVFNQPSNFLSANSHRPCTTSDVTFDVDWQNFTQRTDVGLEWSRGQGSVVTAGHGPQGDHTSGVGYYLYVDVSGGGSGPATLYSPWYSRLYRQGALTFWYYMAGNSTGKLEVTEEMEGMSSLIVFSMSGYQGSSWQNGTLRLSMTLGKKFRLIFKASPDISGDSKGIIAIDDIAFDLFTSCTGCTSITSPVTFDNGFQDFTDQSTPSTGWSIISQASQRAFTSSDVQAPMTSHQTDESYARADGSGMSPASLSSRVLGSPNGYGCTVTLSYRTQPSDVAAINFTMLVVPSDPNYRSLTQRILHIANKTNSWKRVTSQEINLDVEYKLNIQYRGTSLIDIDNITMSDTCCKPLCPLPDISRGEAIGSSFRSNATYNRYSVVCADRYAVSNRAFDSECRNPAGFAEPPTCKALCPLPDIQNGKAIGLSLTSNEAFHKFSVECDVGYILANDTYDSLCRTPAGFAEPPPCKALCSLPEVRHATVKGLLPGKDGKFNQYSITCVGGYTLLNATFASECLDPAGFPSPPKCDEVGKAAIAGTVVGSLFAVAVVVGVLVLVYLQRVGKISLNSADVEQRFIMLRTSATSVLSKIERAIPTAKPQAEESNKPTQDCEKGDCGAETAGHEQPGTADKNQSRQAYEPTLRNTSGYSTSKWQSNREGESSLNQENVISMPGASPYIEENVYDVGEGIEQMRAQRGMPVNTPGTVVEIAEDFYDVGECNATLDHQQGQTQASPDTQTAAEGYDKEADDDSFDDDGEEWDEVQDNACDVDHACDGEDVYDTAA